MKIKIMLSSLLFAITGFSFMSFSNSALPAKTYYFDGKYGNDQHNGLSIEKPFKTLSRIASLELHPGDRLLLKRGSVFNQQTITLTNQTGSAADPICISAYGTGNMPVINPDTLLQYAIQMQACENIEVENVEMKGGMGGITLT